MIWCHLRGIIALFSTRGERKKHFMKVFYLVMAMRLFTREWLFGKWVFSWNVVQSFKEHIFYHIYFDTKYDFQAAPFFNIYSLLTVDSKTFHISILSCNSICRFSLFRKISNYYFIQLVTGLYSWQFLLQYLFEENNILVLCYCIWLSLVKSNFTLLADELIKKYDVKRK